MNTYYLLLFSLFISCTSNSSTIDINEPEQVLSNKELLIKHYKETVVPLFESYSEIDIPQEFKVDTTDLTINAGASFGYVEVSQGLINCTKKEIQIFVLAHEIAHIVTINQAEKNKLEGSIPKGTNTNDYKKAEYLADLIAFHLIHSKQTDLSNLIIEDFNYLENLLGFESFTHPSGIDRVKFLQQYLIKSKETNNEVAFKDMFIKIWYMN